MYCFVSYDDSYYQWIVMGIDSCHGRVIRNQQKFVSYVPPTTVVKLLQYRSLGSNTGMGFHPTNDSH